MDQPFDSDALQVNFNRLVNPTSRVTYNPPSSVPQRGSLASRQLIDSRMREIARTLPRAPTDQEMRISAKRRTRDLRQQQGSASYSGGLMDQTEDYGGNIQEDESQPDRSRVTPSMLQPQPSLFDKFVNFMTGRQTALQPNPSAGQASDTATVMKDAFEVDEPNQAERAAALRQRVTQGLDVPAVVTGRRQGDASIARALGIPAPSPSSTTGGQPSPSSPAVDAPAPSNMPSRPSAVPVPIPTFGDQPEPSSQDVDASAPSIRPARPSAVRTSRSSTQQDVSSPTRDEDDDEEETEETAPRPSRVGAFSTAAGVLTGYAPAIVQAADARGAQKKQADRNLGIATAAQVGNLALPGLGDIVSDVASSTTRTPGGKRAPATPASVAKTAQDVATLAQQAVPQTTAPTPSQSSAPPPPTATPPAPDVPPPPPPPAPTSTTQQQPLRSAQQSGEEDVEDDVQQTLTQNVEKTAVQSGEKVAEKAGGEALGEAAGDAALDAIPGIGEIAALALNVGLAFSGMRRPKPIPPPPPPSVQAFQAGL